MAATDRRLACTVSAALLLPLASGCELSGGLTVEDTPPAVVTDGLETTGDGELSGDPGVSSLPGPPTSGAPATGGETASETGGAGGGQAVIPAGSTWRYQVGDAPAGWRELDFDDSAWGEGPAPLGFGLEVATPLAPGAITHYFRRRFTASEVAGVSDLLLHLRRDDGAVVYLNGAELTRSNMPAGAVSGVTPADSAAGGVDPLRYYKAPVPGDALLEGDNVLAVEVHQRAADSDDLVFDLDMRPFDPSAPLPTLHASVRTVTWGGKYGPSNVGVIWIEREDGSFVRTLERWAAVRKQHLVQWNASSGGNEVDAITAATSGGHRARAVDWDLLDASGQAVAPGNYRLRVEFTEDNSNSGGASSRNIAIPFTLGQPTTLTPADDSSFRDMLLMVP